MTGATLEVHLLGPLQAFSRGRAIALPRSRKTRALLGYVVASSRAHGRDHLCDLLFDGPADPRAALRWSLSKLRAVLEADGATRIVTEADRIAFDPAGARVDLAVIRASLAAGPADTPAAVLEATLELFGGDFLEGLELPGCYRFDAWCAAERAAVRSLRVSILAALAEHLEVEPERAVRFARERLAADPLSEDAHAALIALLAKLGRTNEALEQYERCRWILKRELGTRPSPEMEALRGSLRARGSLPAVEPAGPRLTATRPLAGRVAERRVLEESVASAAAAGSEVLLLVGEPGIGKTRLLAELATIVADAGGEVLAGRAFEAEHVRPYGAWIDVLRTIPAAAVAPALRPELAPLLPELGPAAAETADRNRLFEAVVRLLVDRARDRIVAILLDDLQWADEAAGALLHFVARHAAGVRLLLACAARRAELDENDAVCGMIRDLRRQDRLRTIALGPLDRDDVACLVRGIDPDADAAAVFARSEGNPLFALELVRARSSGDRELPLTLEGLIGDRLATLDADARNVLPWAAALGGGFPLERLARVSELPATDLLRGVEALERRSILQPLEDRYDFTHDLIRATAYGRLSEPRRRLIHARIARTLDAAPDPEGELAGAVAHHAGLAGDHALAARACIAAGWHCLDMSAYREGAELAARGLRQVEPLDPPQRLSLRIRLLELFLHPGMERHRPPDVKEQVTRAIDAAHAAGLSDAEVSGLYLISVLDYQSGEFGGALENTLRAEVAVRDADPITAVRAIADTARCLGLLECEIPRAQRLAGEALALARRLDVERQFHQIPMAFGLLHHHAGELDEAFEAFERASRLAHNQRERWWECACLSRLVMIELERDRPEPALARCNELLDLATSLGEGSDAPFAEALRALALLRLGRDKAAERIDRAIAALRRADSQWMLAYVQSAAAAVHLMAHRLERARSRGADALRAATIAGRPSAIAFARTILARAALEAGDRRAALTHLGPYRASLAGPHILSNRARRAVETTARLIHEIPTHAPTPGPTLPAYPAPTVSQTEADR